MTGKIMYCALPTRLRSLGARAKEIARTAGFSPVVPFDALSYEDSEGGPLSRPRTLKFDIDLMRCCDVLGVFGVAPGVLGEIDDALERNMDIRIFPDFDPEWETMYEKLRPRPEEVFGRIRGPHWLIALVGQRAIGKTFWSQRLRERFGDRIGLVKNTTTRQPGREETDKLIYNFVSREEFEEGIRSGKFLEYDEYFGNYYGSSMVSIREVLHERHGLFAITPRGAQVLWERRLEINLLILNLVPLNDDVIRANMLRRGISDPAEQEKLVEVGKQFHLPPEVGHEQVVITGHVPTDETELFRAIESALKPL